MSKKIYLIFATLLFLKCSNAQNKLSIDINIINNHKPIILNYDTKHKKVFRVQIPFKLEVTNTSSKTQKITSFIYQYSIKNSGLLNDLFEITNNNEHNKISLASIKKLPPFTKKEYLIYSEHLIDSLQNIQNHFIPFLKTKRKSKSIFNINKSTFEKTEFYKNLVKEDSIVVRLINSNNFKRIKLPVKQ